jgi:hypothetical protein
MMFAASRLFARALLLAGSVVAAAPDALATGLDSMDAFVKAARSGRASFTQVVTSPAKEGQAVRSKTSSGSFEFQRPGRFRFSYNAAGRAPAPAHAGRGHRPAASAGRRHGAALAFESGQPHSCILWGPPGVGKTTHRAADGACLRCAVHHHQAVLGGVKDIREAVEHAQARATGLVPRRTIVFVDEVHRFNKSQQDAFLPHVERACSPSSAPPPRTRRSRSTRPAVARHGVCAAAAGRRRFEANCGSASACKAPPAIEKEAARARLVAYADGDARRLLNTLETWASLAGPRAQLATITDAGCCAGRTLRRYDKGGEQFYDTISALHKSVRGSDPDAALYWLAHARRRRRPALPGAPRDPHGQRGHRPGRPARAALALDAAEVYERLGSPEGELALAEAWSTWRWRPSPMPSTRPGTPCAPS